MAAERFTVELVAGRGTDGYRALRILLKIGWRRFGLKCTRLALAPPEASGRSEPPQANNVRISHEHEEASHG